MAKILGEMLSKFTRKSSHIFKRRREDALASNGIHSALCPYLQDLFLGESVGGGPRLSSHGLGLVFVLINPAVVRSVSPLAARDFFIQNGYFFLLFLIVLLRAGSFLGQGLLLLFFELQVWRLQPSLYFL